VDQLTLAASRQIDAALLVADADQEFASCFIDLPQAMAGTKFAKLLRVGDEFFAETADAERFLIPNIDPATFEAALDCGAHYFEVGFDGDIDEPVRYKAEFVSDEPTYRPGV
jgi:hypothetical protein